MDVRMLELLEEKCVAAIHEVLNNFDLTDEAREEVLDALVDDLGDRNN